MASLFSTRTCLCEGEGCKETGDEATADYVVNKVQRLCPKCAAAASDMGAPLPVGDQRTVRRCKSHEDKLATLYCDTHDTLVCEPCRSAYHRDCTLKVIEDAMEETRGLLTELYGKALVRQEENRRLDARLSARVADVEKHFKEQEEAIVAWSDMQYDLKKKAAETKVQEIYRELEIVREEDLEWRRKLESQLQEAREKVESWLQQVKNNNDQLIEDTQHVLKTTEDVLFNESDLLAKGTAAEHALGETLKGSVDTRLMDLAEGITRDIKFVTKGEKDVGRIEGRSRRFWHLNDTITLRGDMKRPRVRFIDENTLGVLDIASPAKGLLSVDLACHTMHLVDMGVSDFVSMHGNRLACVKGPSGVINIYSSDSWLCQKQFRITLGNQENFICDKLTVGSQGRLFVKTSERNIIVINVMSDVENVRSGNILNTKVHNINDMVGLSNGSIVVKNHKNAFVILDRDGNRTRVKIEQDNWERADIAVDRTTDSLYIVYLDKNTKDIGVCRTCAAGGIEEEEFVGGRQLFDARLPTHIDVFESHKLCVCNGSTLFVFSVEVIDI